MGKENTSDKLEPPKRRRGRPRKPLGEKQPKPPTQRKPRKILSEEERRKIDNAKDLLDNGVSVSEAAEIAEITDPNLMNILYSARAYRRRKGGINIPPSRRKPNKTTQAAWDFHVQHPDVPLQEVAQRTGASYLALKKMRSNRADAPKIPYPLSAQTREALRRVDAGEKVRDVARKLNVPRSTIYSALKKRQQ